MANGEVKRSETAPSYWLVLLSLISAAIGYITSITVAQILGADGFEHYAVAIASLAILSTIAEAGTGKFALKAWPEYITTGQLGLASGFVRFALTAVVVISLVILLVAATGESVEGNQFGDHAFGIAVCFLPGVALAGAGIDFVMASRRAIMGSFISRLFIPLLTFVTILFCAQLFSSFDSSWAAACFGMSSCIGASIAIVVFLRTSGQKLRSVTPAYQVRHWTWECTKYLSLAMLVTLTFRISLLVLEVLPVSEIEVSLFAAATETGCLILLLSKSTDKYYQPYISVMLMQQSWDEAVTMRRQRYKKIGIACLLFLGIVVFFGRRILGLYGEEFKDGYLALCFVAFGASTWTVFSLAPAYLKFVAKDQFVFLTNVFGAFAMATLTFTLGMHWGATGAAFAFCVVLCAVSLANLFVATKHFAGIRQTIE
ncbi:MAG: lipopolysaccharide biosynthesis protein [Planctomycetota bacterium]